MTPVLKTPLDNPAVRAMIDARQEYSIEWVLKHIQNDRLVEMTRIAGDYDPDGDPYIEYLMRIWLFMVIGDLRKVQGNNAPELLKAEGTEWANFLTACKQAGVGLE